MIAVRNLSYQYPGGTTAVIQDFSCTFAANEIVALSGANGCGKTTLGKLIAGILRPRSGQILIDGQDTAKADLFSIGQKMGYLFQNPDHQIFCESVEQEIAYGLYNQGLPEQAVKQTVDHYLAYFQLVRRRDSYPLHLSVGEKQRLMLAAVLALGTKYLLLDEPTSGLDMRRRQELGHLLQQLRQERGLGIVVISHERDFMRRFCSREVVMQPCG